MRHRALCAARVERLGRDLEHHAHRMSAAADRRDERDLIALGDHRAPLGHPLVPGRPCTAGRRAGGACVPAAPTPLALPVTIEARGGRPFTYSVTWSRAAKCRLPTTATRTATANPPTTRSCRSG